MSAFSAEWLALREPYDLRARNAAVLESVRASMADLPSISVVDLACGTGSGMRALAPMLPARQTWRLVDNNLSLLARVSAAGMPPSVSATAIPIDLVHDLEAALDGALDLVTTSALLDLVSETWLERLVTETAARGLPLYAALSYDGRIEWTPADPYDRAVACAVNAHQRRDKGFGPALGPQAAPAAIARFKRLGYNVISGASDWVFAPQEAEMQATLLAGWAAAAREFEPGAAAEIDAWCVRRAESIAAGSSLRVSHMDFFARARA